MTGQYVIAEYPSPMVTPGPCGSIAIMTRVRLPSLAALSTAARGSWTLRSALVRLAVATGLCVGSDLAHLAAYAAGEYRSPGRRGWHLLAGG